ncbi:MAG: diacylglycerol kinase family protein [Bauldia sp.]
MPDSLPRPEDKAIAPAPLNVVVILNKGAGKNAAAEGSLPLDESLAAAFSAQGIAAEIVAPEPAGLTAAAEAALARARRKEIDAVVAGGGDGTIRSVAAVLADSGVPLGILPLGTLNHFAKDIGIPVDVDKAIGVIAERQIRAVDLGEVNGASFVNNSSIGIYPYMVLDRERRQKLRGMGKWTAMVLAFFRVMRAFPRRRIAVRADGATESLRTPCLFVGNNEYGTHVFSLGKRECLDAGALWLYVAHPKSPAAFLSLAVRIALGRIDAARDLTVLKVRSAEIAAAASRLPVALDGEVEILSSPLKYRIRPKALAVFAPLASAPETAKP